MRFSHPITLRSLYESFAKYYTGDRRRVYMVRYISDGQIRIYTKDVGVFDWDCEYGTIIRPYGDRYQKRHISSAISGSFYMILGENIDGCLIAKHHDAKWLAETIGIDPATMRMYIRGDRKIPITVLIDVSDALCLNVDDILSV